MENRARVVVFGQALIQFESTFRRLEYTWGHDGVGYGLLQCLQNGIASDQEPQGPFFFAPTEHSTFFRLSPDAILGKARAVPTFCNCPNAVGSGLALGASSYHQRVLCRGHRPLHIHWHIEKKNTCTQRRELEACGVGFLEATACTRQTEGRLCALWTRDHLFVAASRVTNPALSPASGLRSRLHRHGIAEPRVCERVAEGLGEILLGSAPI